MVWNTTQSAFYKAIDAFNNGDHSGDFQDDVRNEKCCDDSKSEAPLKPPKNPEKNGKDLGRDREKKDACSEALPPNHCQGCPVCQRRSSAPLSELFSDRDMLLIAGLILILSQQNADRKLILALAFVLLT